MVGHSSAAGRNTPCSGGFSSTLLSGAKAALKLRSHGTVQALKCWGNKQTHLAAFGNSRARRKNIPLPSQNQSADRRRVLISLGFETSGKKGGSLKGWELLNKHPCWEQESRNWSDFWRFIE